MSDTGTQPTSDAPPRPSGSAKTERRAQRRSRTIRITVLGVVLAAITALGFAHLRGVQVVGVDALCPFGGIETLWALITKATLVQRVAASSVILLGGVLLMALLFRRAFCGYVCPLGAIQEFFGMIGRKIFGRRRPSVPLAVDRIARYLKYVVLVGFAVWSWQAASLVIRPYDPWVAWMHLTSSELLAEFGVGAAVLGVSVVGSVFYERFFCKYACPMGALLGVMAPLSVFKVRREASVCTDCKACDAVCPTNVAVSTAATVNDPECINCNECVNVCPAKGALEVSAPAGIASGKILTPNTVLIGAAVVLALVIGGTTLSGSFAWTMPTLATAAEAAKTTGASINVEEIKGSMTFDEVAKATGIPEAKFIARFGIKQGDMKTPMKDLAEAHGFDIHTDVRAWVEEQMASGVAK
jgi:polyferredoxin